MSANPQPLIDAVKAAVVAGGVAIGDGIKPANATTRWLVAWFDGGTIDDRSLRSRDGFTLTVTLHGFGLSPEAARFAIRKARDGILGLHRAVVDGRTVQMPEQLVGLPMQRDDDVDPPLFLQIDEWRIKTSA